MIEKTKNIDKNVSYEGTMRNYQINNGSNNNFKQKELLRRAIYGLNIYSYEEIFNMNSSKKARIQKVHKKTSTVINRLKQNRLNEITNKLFESLFPDSNFAKELINNTFIDDSFSCKISLKDLQITKENLIDDLINENILPKNFYKL